ncbi:response regulator [Methylomonas sp. ZR1]|uniref:response regulator n=1 Tax=Methylomonas sp. ZR1 TaxID=1797072 RepID=UPI0020A547BF|nr:response regulator [Methylomonas sp. ZR1]
MTSSTKRKYTAMAESTHPPRTLLLVDDEPNIINALKRTLRRDGYSILTANGAEEALDLLVDHNIALIISDQRMPKMSGVEFLRKVKELYPKTVRVVLSGFTDLESVTGAINEGAIYRFMTKPWDDELLRKNVREAFEYHEMEQENQRLTRELQHSNDLLARLNQSLEQQVMQKTREIVHNIKMLEISQEILEHLPLAILGLDERHMIASSNRLADSLFQRYPNECLLGLQAESVLPAPLLHVLQQTKDSETAAEFNGSCLDLGNSKTLYVWISPMGELSQSKGTIVALSSVKT